MEQSFSADAKKLGDQIVSDIREQFISKIGTLEWMDDEVKKLAVDKVNAIDQKIGYPEQVCSRPRCSLPPDQRAVTDMKSN